MYGAIYIGDNSAKAKIEQNAEQGRRTLVLCFYAGHAATVDSKTSALLNSNQRDDHEAAFSNYDEGGNQFDLELLLGACIKQKGAYVISLLACDRIPMPEEGKRGGTAGPIQDPG